jgi:hypothetical protein
MRKLSKIFVRLFRFEAKSWKSEAKESERSENIIGK